MTRLSQEEIDEELKKCFYSDLYAKESELTCYGCSYLLCMPIQIYHNEPERYRWYCRELNNVYLGTSDFDSPHCIVKSVNCPLRKLAAGKNNTKN